MSTRTYSAEVLKAAEELGLSPSELAGDFTPPSFVAKMGYQLQIVKAVNSFTKRGCHQLQTTVVPVTADGKQVRQGTFTRWYAYPFDVQGRFAWADAMQKDRARQELTSLLYIAQPELRSYKVEQVGTEKLYVDAKTGDKLTDVQLKGIRESDRINVARAMRALEKDPSSMKGVTYHAIFSPWENKDGETQFGWSYVSAAPLADKEYATTRAAMFGSTSSENDDTHSEESPF